MVTQVHVNILVERIKFMAETTTEKPTRALTLREQIDKPNIRARFNEVLGKKAPGFVSSVISAVKTNAMLNTCPPESIISAAMIAATLDLPINPNLGFAFIVPYKKAGVPLAQFQIGWKGYTQLAMRSGQFARMNASPVFEGQLIKWDPITTDFEYDLDKKTSETIIGYVSYFRLTNGFEHYWYMPIADIRAHAAKYSQTYKKGYGPWTDNFEAMCLKTVHKLNLSKWAPMTQDMELAINFDQGVVKNAPAYLNGDDVIAEFPDGAEVPGATSEIVEPEPANKVSPEDMKPGDASTHQGHEPQDKKPSKAKDGLF